MFGIGDLRAGKQSAPLLGLSAPFRVEGARRTATVVALLTVLVSLTLLIVVAVSAVTMNRAVQKMEENQIERELDRVVVAVLDEQKSVALWDEAVSRIAAKDTQWLDAEIGAYLNGGYGHDEVYLLDGRDRLIYAYPQSQDVDSARRFQPVRKILNPLIDEVRSGRASAMRVRDAAFVATYGLPSEIGGASALRWSAHLMRTEQGPAVVSVMSVVPTTPAKTVAPPPLLVSVMHLDAARLAALADNASVSDLVFSSGDAPSAAPAHIALTADDGQMIGKLGWSPHHPGRKLMFYLFPVLLCGTLWVMFVSFTMLRRLTAMSRGLEHSEQEAVRLAYHDLLSDLPNRRKFADTLSERLVAWRAGQGDRPLIAYIDLDRFKDINDTMGHEVGDMLVRSVGERLGQVLPEGNLLARLGGDEFAVVAASADPLAGWKLGRELCAAFNAPVDAGGQEVAISASVGVAIPTGPNITPAQLMCEADIALYRAKEAGRSRAVIFRPEMAEAVERRRQTELDLRQAIARNQLRLVYQPVLTIEGPPRFNSVEALLRWDHPVRGLISPDEFIPIAETSGQMPALGEWVLGQALKDGARWPGLKVAVNLSPMQLKADGFVRRVVRMVAEAHAIPSQIILEVTESVMMDATGQAGQALKELRELGFKIALDDFGTGYSSLSYLRQFRFDRLKIDRSFIEGVGEDDDAMSVIEMVVALGRKLGLEVVAEGIENEVQAKLMKAAGCTHLQGWFVARPMDTTGIAKMLDTSPRVEPIVQMLRGSAA